MVLTSTQVPVSCKYECLLKPQHLMMTIENVQILCSWQITPYHYHLPSCEVWNLQDSPDGTDIYTCRFKSYGNIWVFGEAHAKAPQFSSTVSKIIINFLSTFVPELEGGNFHLSMLPETLIRFKFYSLWIYQHLGSFLPSYMTCPAFSLGILCAIWGCQSGHFDLAGRTLIQFHNLIMSALESWYVGMFIEHIFMLPTFFKTKL